MIGLYLHIPFCASKCAYCDFYSFPPASAGAMDDYTDALCRRMAEWPHERADTVYFGGGTPSLLGGARLTRILEAARAHFDLTPDAEITVECNPDSMDGELLRALRSAGVDRLSVGVQSAFDDELRLLGRRHDREGAFRALERAKNAGFDELSVDLMYALPGQSTERVLESAERLLAFAPTHLSCYGLKLEAGTPLHRAAPILPDEDAQADTYLALSAFMTASGFEHYEISNFALPGHRARHNSKYWALAPYLGLGPGAHSCYQGRRFYFPRDAAAFLAGEPPVEEEPVEGFDARAEYLMLGLRVSDGIDLAAYERRFGSFVPFERVLARYETPGLTRRTAGGWALTPRGFLVSNAVILEVLDALDSR